MRRRKWTDEQIREALATPGVPGKGRRNPATRFYHPVTGKVVVVDNVTGEIFHVGGTNYGYRNH